jgi:oligopeptide/dipeptide ABC transporter ATP-binding protein
MTALLEIGGLSVTIPVHGRPQRVIQDVSLALAPGEALAIVGESGAGKSMTVRAILRMLPAGASAQGGLRFDGRDVSSFTERELRHYRANDVGIVFQDPRAHVNPVRRVGDFLIEPLVRLRGMKPAAARARVAAILAEIGVADGERRFRQFPHELSGGLLQRMMIASVVAMEPRLILADEPTTALDATTQSDVMAILGELRASRDLALLLVTHDLDLGAAVCDRMAVMYAGTIVEERSAADVIDDPLHPYTAGLGASRPGMAAPGARLPAISGRPVSAFEAPEWCPFEPRCAFAQSACTTHRPPLSPLAGGRVACVRAAELRGKLAPAPAGVLRD